ncbi:unnamed protein product [Alopecurus aequalis]
MPPRQSNSGYRGVRLRPSSVFYTHDAPRAWDIRDRPRGRPRVRRGGMAARAAATQDEFRRGVDARAGARPRAAAVPVTVEDRRHHRQRERRLLVADADEQAMAEWRRRFPEDVAAENAFWAQRQAERHARRVEKRARKAVTEACIAGDVFDWVDDDLRWGDLWTSSDNNTSEEEGVVSD